MQCLYHQPWSRRPHQAVGGWHSSQVKPREPSHANPFSPLQTLAWPVPFNPFNQQCLVIGLYAQGRVTRAPCCRRQSCFIWKSCCLVCLLAIWQLTCKLISSPLIRSDVSYQTHFFRTQNNLQKTSLGIKRREMWFSVRLFVFATALLLVGGDTDAGANSSSTTTTAPTDSTTGILYSVDLVANYTTRCSNIKPYI